MTDLSKCQCSNPGWCPVFRKEMGTTPPNWRWCKDATEEERLQHLSVTSGDDDESDDSSPRMVDIVEFVHDPLPCNSEYAVCVIPANKSALGLLDITRDSIKSYAERCGADYIELTGDQHPNWTMANKYRLHNVSSTYEKTLYLDCDVLVNPNSPNLFKATPDDKISAYDEYETWKDTDSIDWIQRQHERLVYKYCDGESRERLLNNGKFTADSMINGGVMMIPQCCSDYYKQPTKKYPNYWCFDQSYLTLTLPPEKFNPLNKEWNLEYVLKDVFWYNLPEANFIHVNGLRKNPEFREFLLRQIKYGDFTKSELELFSWFKQELPEVIEEITKPHEKPVVTNKFKENRVGIVFNQLANGGSTVWLKDFIKCFSKEITGIFSLGSNEPRGARLGIDRGYNVDELYELYVKSDVMIYWIYDPSTILENKNVDYLPDFIWKNPLKKKIILLSHGGLRLGSDEFLIKKMSPDVSVFIDGFAADYYNGVCIPPMVQRTEGLIRVPRKRNVLWHHRLEYNKGVETLRGIVDLMPDFTFHVAGSWNPKERESFPLNEKGYQYHYFSNVEDYTPENVLYYGHLDKEQMRTLFEGCSLSLSTSYDESFGLSVAESIVNGIPSVSHRAGVGIYSDIVVPYCAKPSEWERAIRECEETVSVAKSRDYLLERFSPERFEEEWRKVIY